jgi:hypothetical protein
MCLSSGTGRCVVYLKTLFSNSDSLASNEMLVSDSINRLQIVFYLRSRICEANNFLSVFCLL